MTQESWLPLADYSMKYKVSVSTLRRRIKTEDIRFRFDDGKYLIMDEPMDLSSQKGHRPSLNSELTSRHEIPAISEVEIQQKTPKEEPILTAANKLLHELKRAYTQILQEKEEQILHLKEEVADLKTLVRVLESENERLKGFKQ
ncbi:MAG: hypothetical protein ACLGGX_00700 [Bdellovibrionia bacterium]